MRTVSSPPSPAPHSADQPDAASADAPALTPSAAPRDQTRLAREFYERSSAFGYLHSLPDLTLFVACLAAIGWAPWPINVVASLVIAVVAYRMTFIIHDTSHGTLFAGRRENLAVGWLCSSLVIVSFPMFKRLHQVHHRHYRGPDDPQGIDYVGFMPGRDRVLWHLTKPLLALNFVDKMAAFLSLSHCGMTREEQHEAKSVVKSASPGERWKSTACILAAQAVVITLATRGFTFWWGLLLLVPIPLIGLFLSRVRSYLEHGDLVHTDEPGLIARTHRSNVIERNLLSSILFNFHNEHHRWPQVPSRLLPRVHEEVTAGRLPDEEYSRSYLSSLGRLVSSCFGRSRG